MKFIIILFLLILCGGKEYGYYHNPNLNIPYFENKLGVKLNQNFLQYDIAGLGDNSKYTLGTCTHPDIHISNRQEHWKNRSIEITILHEIGHCFAKMEHVKSEYHEDGCKKFIMSTYEYDKAASPYCWDKYQDSYFSQIKKALDVYKKYTM